MRLKMMTTRLEVCLIAWAIGIEAASDHELFLPWSDAPLTVQSISLETLVEFPPCDLGKNGDYDVECTHEAVVVVSQCFGMDERRDVDAWVEYMQALTQDKVYLIDGQQCILEWKLRVSQHNCSVPPSHFKHTPKPEKIAESRVHYDQEKATIQYQPKKYLPSRAWKGSIGSDETLSLTNWHYGLNPNGALIEVLGRQLISKECNHYVVALMASSDAVLDVNAWVQEEEVCNVASVVIATSLQPHGSPVQTLYENDFLSKWNLPHLNTWYHCSESLFNAIPLFYIDSNSNRRCECRCAHGYEISFRQDQAICEEVDRSITPQCTFKDRAYSYDIRTPSGRQLYPLVSHIPYPIEPYSNVSLKISQGSNIVYNAALPWMENEDDRNHLLDNVPWPNVGKFMISLSTREAVCEICLAIVDRYRPLSLHQCPQNLSGEESVMEYTKSTCALAQSLISQHYRYSEDVLNNDQSEEQCNDKKHWKKDFFDKTYKRYAFESGRTCFQNILDVETIARLKEPSFGRNLSNLALIEPVQRHQCTRCCKYETILQEFWTEFTCYSNSFERKCSSADAGCRTTQCLTAFGSSLFQASAVIAQVLVNSSQELSRTLFTDEKYNASRHVLIQLDCTLVDDHCVYTNSIDQLFEVSSAVVFDQTELLNDSHEYVQWRYRVQGGAWHTYGDAVPIYFKIGVSSIQLEAWSQCGIVTTAEFEVIIHAQASLCVAEAFDTMWYQSSIRDTNISRLWTYKGTEFAELTFDYDPAMGVLCSPMTTIPPWNVTEVVCTGKYLNSTIAAPLLDRSSHVGPIVQRFAIYIDNTTTRFQVHCSFKYFSHGYNASAQVRVSKLFHLERSDGVSEDIPISVCQGVVVQPHDGLTVVHYVSTKCQDNTDCMSMFSLPIDQRSDQQSPSSIQDIYVCQVHKNSAVLTVLIPTTYPSAMLCLVLVAVLLVKLYLWSRANTVEYSPLLDIEV